MSGRRSLVFGGAGFIGSHIVERLVDRGDEVVVVDGLMTYTGGSVAHLAAVADRIDLRLTPIEELADLSALLAGAELIVDCMAWTRHVAALADPAYDLRLNLASHLQLLKHLPSVPGQKVIYLASRSQYGRTAEPVLTEETPMNPADVQGVHKTAAEQHFRIQAGLRQLNVASVRLPNCFGERQPLEGADVGLVGEFIRKLQAGQAIEVFGTGRKRCLLYVADAADAVVRIADADVRGFMAINAEGSDIEISALAQLLALMIGSGRVDVSEMPHRIRQIDVPHATIDPARIRHLVGELPRTALETALTATVAYFKEHTQ